MSGKIANFRGKDMKKLNYLFKTELLEQKMPIELNVGYGFFSRKIIVCILMTLIALFSNCKASETPITEKFPIANAVIKAFNSSNITQATQESKSTGTGTSPFKTNPPDETLAVNPLAGQTYSPSTTYLLSSNNTNTISSYSVGGYLSGNTGTVSIKLNNSETLSLSSPGSFVFTTSISVGNPYSVTLVSSPSGQTCSISNPAGTISNYHISNVYLTCYNPSVAASPTILLLKPSTEVDRFQNLEIDFSDGMDKASVCDDSGQDSVESDSAKISLKDSLNTNIPGRCYWSNYRRLSFDPYQALKTNETYTFSIPSAKTYNGVSVSSYSKTFTTEAGFVTNLTLNGLATGSKPMTFDMTANSNSSTLNLSGTIADYDKLLSLTLKKLGVDGSVTYYTVCPSACASGTITNLNLQSAVPAAMRPTQGGNTYYFEIKTLMKTYYRTFSFLYGSVASNKDDIYTNAVSMALDTSNSVSALNTMLKSYSKQQFTLKGKSLIEIIRNTKLASLTSGSVSISLDDTSYVSAGMIVTGSGIPSSATVVSVDTSNNTVQLSAAATITGTNVKLMFMGNSAPATDSSGNTCLAWQKNGGTNFKVPYYPKIGPFCNIQVDGIIFSGTSPVKYAALADVYITYLDIPGLAQPGSLDNIEINLKPGNGLMEIYLLGKKANGKMAMVAKIPSTTKMVASISNGATSFTVPNNTDLIKGMILSGINASLQDIFSSSTYITSISGNTITISKPTIAAATGSNVTFDGIELFGYLVNNTFVFSDDSSPKDGNSLIFAMNEDPPNTTSRNSYAQTSLSVGAFNPLTDYGRVTIALNPSLRFDSTYTNIIAPFNYNLTNPITKDWSDAINVDPLDATGAVGAVIADVVIQKIPEVKPRVVQGVVKDIAERVAPDIVNIILGDLYNGIKVNLPSYLPGILNKVQIQAKASVNTDMTSKTIGLETSANAKVDGCIKTGTASTDPCASITNIPPTPYSGTAGTVDSFLVFKDANFLTNSKLEIESATLKRNGAMIALHPDVVNQAIYKLWQKGVINLTLSKDFADQIAKNQFPGDNLGYRASTRLLEIFEIILKAKSLMKVLAPGRQNLYAKDGSGNLIKIDPDDDMEFRLNPIQPVSLKVLPLTTDGISSTLAGDKGAGDIIGKKIKVEASMGDLLISIYGNKCANRNQVTGSCITVSSTYLVVNLRVNLKSKGSFSFGSFSNPFNDPAFTQTVNGITQPLPAVKVNVCDDVVSGSPDDCDQDSVTDLYYTLEIGDDITNNPLGLSPLGIYDVLNPTVQKLIVPLVNYILEEIPLPAMKSCGLQLYDLQIAPITNTSLANPFLILNSKITNYDFTGDCSL